MQKSVLGLGVVLLLVSGIFFIVAATVPRLVVGVYTGPSGKGVDQLTGDDRLGPTNRPRIPPSPSSSGPPLSLTALSVASSVSCRALPQVLFSTVSTLRTVPSLSLSVWASPRTVRPH